VQRQQIEKRSESIKVEKGENVDLSLNQQALLFLKSAKTYKKSHRIDGEKSMKEIKRQFTSRVDQSIKKLIT